MSAAVPADSAPSTPQPSASIAQSKDGGGNGGRDGGGGHGGGDGGDGGKPPRQPGEGESYRISPRLTRAMRTRPYERRQGDPIYRPLRIYSLDPSTSRFDGAVAIVNIPYERLRPGPVGAIFEVDGAGGDPTRDDGHAAPLDLNDRALLIGSGRKPSPSDPGFRHQMVYAVASLVYDAFRVALGRTVAWPFDRSGTGPIRLRLVPVGSNQANAYYDPEAGAIHFGCFPVPNATRLIPKDGRVYAALSHDVVAHEVTHAVLHGLRAHFTTPTGPDVLGFHEGFADLIAAFQHFTFEGVVRAALRASRESLKDATLLTSLAREFGEALGENNALRTVADAKTDAYGSVGDEPHRLGSVLASAVFEALETVFRRKTAPYLRLATGGTGILPQGAIPADLESVLAHEAAKLAGHFMTICIRALDYCPPVDLEFGEYLRAVVTADADLVPDDPHGYREALIAAFGRRSMFPRGVNSIAEDDLMWRPPAARIGPVRRLTFANQRFDGDPGRPASPKELAAQAGAIGALVSDPRHAAAFGLAAQGDPTLQGDRVEPPVVESVRTARRIGPDGQIMFDTIAEVVQRRLVPDGEGGYFPFLGGATIIFDAQGRIRYAITKSIGSTDRLERQRAFMKSDVGQRYWPFRGDGGREPHPMPFQLLHERQAGKT